MQREEGDEATGQRLISWRISIAGTPLVRSCARHAQDVVNQLIRNLGIVVKKIVCCARSRGRACMYNALDPEMGSIKSWRQRWDDRQGCGIAPGWIGKE